MNLILPHPKYQISDSPQLPTTKLTIRSPMNDNMFLSSANLGEVVEGSEYATLAAMLVKGALCQVSKISMEWHDFMCSGPLCAVSARFEELTHFVRSTPGCANLTLVMFDDESYRVSRFELPA